MGNNEIPKLAFADYPDDAPKKMSITELKLIRVMDYLFFVKLLVSETQTDILDKLGRFSKAMKLIPSQLTFWIIILNLW